MVITVSKSAALPKHIAQRTTLPKKMQADAPDKFPHPQRGKEGAPIVVLCDTPSTLAMNQGTPMEMDLHRWFAQRASHAEFTEGDFIFVCITPPVSEVDKASASRTWKFAEQYQEKVRNIVEEIDPSMVVTCGAIASRMMVGRAVKITKIRGVLTDAYNGRTVFPMLSPKLCKKQPDNDPIFRADLGTLKRLKDADFDPEILRTTDVDYQWATDLSDFMGDNKPAMLAVDTETTGLDYRAPDFKVLTVQLSRGPGHARIFPLPKYAHHHREWFEEHGFDVSDEQLEVMSDQIKTLMEDASIKKMAHNFKYDDGSLSYSEGIDVHGWDHDTELMTRAVNENMMSYSLDDCVRIYVPEMSGYADAFNVEVNKNDMLNVDPEMMLPYAGGDPDAVYRLARALYPPLRNEPGQMFLYRNVQMRGLLSFAKRIEGFGQAIDRHALDAYRTEVIKWVNDEGEALFKMIPAVLRRKYLTNPDVVKTLKKNEGERTTPDIMFGKDNFCREVLFTEAGFGLKPKVFTKTTEKLPEDKRIPSISTKDHLPYFTHVKGDAGNFVQRFIEYKKAQKLLSTYINGFYKYIKPANDDTSDEKIFPSYNFRTNTSRTNSQDPNGQNFPKRGRFAKGFLKLIRASAGKVLVAADMSQVELRLTAWSAMEKEMLNIYRAGGDIHAATASAVSRIPFDVFSTWKGNDTLLMDVANDIPGSGDYLRSLNSSKRAEATLGDFFALQRFRAKAVNFGYIYGAQWSTFQVYAKTNYGVDYSDAQAKETRVNFFDKYDLLPWHKNVEDFVTEHGFVQTLHHGVRHLPAVWSDDWSIKTSAIRQAVNAPIQRFGSDLGVIAIARLAAQADPKLMRPVGFVHDQLICEVDPGYVNQAMGWLCWIMENPPLQEWFGIEAPLPFVADPEFGYNLAETTEVKRDNIVVEEPPWWDRNESEAYDRFMANDVPDWNVARELSPRKRKRVCV